MPKPLAEIYHLDLFGLRKDKYQTLLDNSISSLPWNKIDCRAPNYFFIAKDFDVLEQYEQGFSVCDLFTVNASGIKTHRDDFAIDMDKATLKNRIECFYDQNAIFGSYLMWFRQIEWNAIISGFDRFGWSDPGKQNQGK